jgi:peptidyl-prolyl cis-trans isomerase A (cyclophilin A)
MTHRCALLLSILCALAACGGSVPVKERPAPPEYKVKLATTKGDVVILVHRDWAPNGADHFYNLVKRGYYDNNAFFRALKDYIVQWGINGDPKVYARWDAVKIKDDPPKMPNKIGTVVFATPSEPNQRTTHIFVNIHDNSENLDSRGFVPFGEVILGLNNIMNVYMDYGEGAPDGNGPSQEEAAHGGNAYFKKNFPNLDYIVKATVIP